MMRSNLTTLCYIERGDEYLMLHRVKKENDVNRDKWIGVGGHFEEGESPEDCLLREVYEETGLTLKSWHFCGIVTFCFTPEGASVPEGTLYDADARTDGSDAADHMCEYMHLYTAQSYEGILKKCDEGDLVWIHKDSIDKLPIWEGDRIFLKLLKEQRSFFSLKLSYRGSRLMEAVLNGKQLTLPDTKNG